MDEKVDLHSKGNKKPHLHVTCHLFNDPFGLIAPSTFRCRSIHVCIFVHRQFVDVHTAWILIKIPNLDVPVKFMCLHLKADPNVKCPKNCTFLLLDV